jgi:general L-amino acid transport system substrate-binding protein
MKRSAIVLAALTVLVPPAVAGTLDAVKSRGVIACGVNGELQGFGVSDARGQWTGFDVDYCRAYAAAIFNDPNKVKYVALAAKDRLTALQAGGIDVLVRNTTWSNARESQFGLLATGATYYDGQGFMVPKKLKINSTNQLGNRSICVEQGTTSEANIADYFGARGAKVTAVPFVERDAAVKAYGAGQRDAFTSDASTLYGARLKIGKVEDHVILSDLISREPLSPFVRQGDDAWFSIIRWVHFALLNAEALGIRQTTVDRELESTNPAIRRLLGSDDNSGEQMGLTRDWAYRVIKRIGNYGEIFDENLGRGSPLKITRGLNALWTDGGIQYAPEFR